MIPVFGGIAFGQVFDRSECFSGEPVMVDRAVPAAAAGIFKEAVVEGIAFPEVGNIFRQLDPDHLGKLEAGGGTAFGALDTEPVRHGAPVIGPGRFFSARAGETGRESTVIPADVHTVVKLPL